MDPPPRRRPGPAVIAGLAALAAILAVTSRELGSLGGDNAEYVLLARSLGEFRGYASGWAPGPPVPHTLFPPGLPLLLAPFAGGAPGSFLACHLVIALAGAAAVFLVARLFERRGLPPGATAAAALVPALSTFWLRNAVDVLAELPFLAFAAGALLLLEPGAEERLPPRRIAGAAALAALAFLTRTAGLALLLPVAAALAFDRRCRDRAGWIAAGGLAAVAAGWFLYGSAGGGSGYMGQLGADGGGLLARTWKGLLDVYLPNTPRFVFPYAGSEWTWAGVLLWALGFAAVACGILRRRGLAVAEGFFLVTLAMQSAWPFQDPRFAIPLAALLIPFAVEQVRAVAAPWKGAAASGVLAAGIAGLFLLPNAAFFATNLLPRSLRDRPADVPGAHEPARFAESWVWTDDQYRQAAPALASFLHACDVVREGTLPGLPSHGPVLAVNPRVAALLCGRPAVQPPAGAGPDRVAALVREKGVAVVLVDAFAGGHAEALRGYAAARAGELEPLLTLPGGVAILRVRK